jgi:hypothetical protein
LCPLTIGDIRATDEHAFAADCNEPATDTDKHTSAADRNSWNRPNLDWQRRHDPPLRSRRRIYDGQ